MSRLIDVQAMELTRLQAETETLREALAEAEQRYDATIASTSWRLTRPVRALKIASARFSGLLLHNPVIRRLRAFSKTLGIDDSRQKTYRLPVPRIERAPPARRVRLVAFYLPQFHPIPENDDWWGKGFTEWTNVRRGEPRFVGQLQPLQPSDLGYYDLLETDGVQRAQAKLAEDYGVEAFCFYFYWFGGKTLLEAPIRKFVEDPKIRLPFCLCWANENWSRRWDGLENEVLIAQDHSAADDMAFIRYITPYLRSDRYLRLDGKAVLLVYRPSLLPDPLATAQRWRAWCRENGVGEIHLVYTQSFEASDPAQYGFDAATEFPPNNTGPPLAEDVVVTDPDFGGMIYDYSVYPERAENYRKPEYPLYRGVFPAWDNEARRPGRGTSFAGCTPELYHDWLRRAAEDTLSRRTAPDHRLVFINAWNEWAEGATLEPDQHRGYAHLEATRDALDAVAAGRSGRRLALVIHDAFRHGAQFLGLNLARVLCDDLGFGLDILLLENGPLATEFGRFGKVHDLSHLQPDGAEADEFARALQQSGVIAAICNTTVSARFLQPLNRAGIRCVSLVHEMTTLLEARGLRNHALALARFSDVIVFPAAAVRDGFEGFVGRELPQSLVRTQGAYKRNCHRTEAQRKAAASALRRRLGLPSETKIVLGVGYGDLRKGFDLFADVAAAVQNSHPNTVFIWVGDVEPKMLGSVDTSQLILAGFQQQTDDYYAAADVYALTSREDPFPTVIMEAFDAVTPVVAFQGAGGFDDVLDLGAGQLAPPFDTDAFADHVNALLANPAAAIQMGELGRSLVEDRFQFGKYAADLAALADPTFKRVSVVVPNYNYARYLPDRLSSIGAQTERVYELIVLDDQSTDDSLNVISDQAEKTGLAWRLDANVVNSGSVFKQWLKGVEQATGDLVWIAEADDLADPDLLATALKAFEDPKVVLSYVQSRQIDADGAQLAENYFAYTEDVSSDRWSKPYIAEGKDEVALALSVKNTIPNVSAVVFRRAPLLQVLQDHRDTLSRLRFAGDWFVYVELLKLGRAAFSPAPLNHHRRHQSGVTLGGLNAQQLSEILWMQRHVAQTVSVPPKLRTRARDYAQELYVTFGLASTETPVIADDPRFSLDLG